MSRTEWINHSDQERLYRYVTEISTKEPVFPHWREELGSYFIEGDARPGARFPDLMPYTGQSLLACQERLRELWGRAGHDRQDLLIKIVLAAAMKNEPFPLTEQEAGEAYPRPDVAGAVETEAATEIDEPGKKLASIFVYEF